MVKEIKILNRFTTLPILLDFLERKKLVLLDPKSWDDRNDTEVIMAYKEKKNIEQLFALCFTHDYETIHHWKTFAHGPSGCCIEFNAQKLLKIFDAYGLNHGLVSYKKISEIRKKVQPLNQLPFTKRIPYECEKEYRVIYEGSSPCVVFEIDVPLSCINKITISQQMPEPVFQTIKKLLKNTFKDPAKRISRSTIYENKIWIDGFRR